MKYVQASGHCRRGTLAGAFLVLGVLLLGTATVRASASALSVRHVSTLPRCSEQSPCHFAKGTYRLGSGTVLRGLQLTLPRGWSSHENDQGELNLIPPGRPGAALFVWMDMEAVKSHGGRTSVLTNVGRTPAALVSWLTTNPDFLVVSPPRPAKVAGRIPATTLTIGVSKSANYGDPACPANPRCADLFTSHWWGANSYGIGGAEEVQLSLARIRRGTRQHTLIVALDAGTGSDNHGLITLRRVARSIVSSFLIPKDVSAG